MSITEFADRVVLGGHAYVAVYSRVAVDNGTTDAVMADPEPSPGLVPLNTAPDTVAPQPVGRPRLRGGGRPLRQRATVAHPSRLGRRRWFRPPLRPHEELLEPATGPDRRRRRPRRVARRRLPQPASSTPRSPAAATTLNTGVNGYESEFSHDVIGILANLFTQGDFADAHALLLDARNVVGSQGQYDDGIWTYAWPWAIYLMKTGDLAFVKANFATAGPDRAAQPSIEDTAHTIAADRTGPGGIMGITDDIDTNGYWTVDDYEALMGLAAYRYLAQQVGDTTEVQWATAQYNDLLAATNRTLDATIARYQLDLSALFDDPAQYGQPVCQPRGRQLGRPLPVREMGLGRPAVRRHRVRTRPHPHRRHLRLRIRPAAGHAPARHLRRLPVGLLLDRLQRRLRQLGTGQRPPPRPGNPELRVHDRQRPERPLLVVGELERPLDHHSVDRERIRPPARVRRPTPGACPRRTRCCWTPWWPRGPTVR